MNLNFNCLSVVIPTYGREAVLVDSIRYLRAMAAPADELLVVDQTARHDDATTAFLASADCEGSIRWIRHQPPGVVGAMNRGLREAKGNIVLFLDDDIIPGPHLIAAHRQAYVEYPEAWAVVGRVVQGGRDEGGKLKAEGGERDEGGKLKAEGGERDEGGKLKAEGGERPQTADRRLQASNQKRRTKNQERRTEIQVSGFRHQPSLRRDLDFHFNGSEPAWVENVMAGNLSVKRDKALAIGGFDENYIPPVSFRFETDFAKRIVKAGGRIRFEPQASIRHLRAAHGGTRSQGSHMASGSPIHGVGDYYYALKNSRGWDRIRYMARRPFREVCTKFHLRHPWWIPVKFVGELRAMWMANKLKESYK